MICQALSEKYGRLFTDCLQRQLLFEGNCVKIIETEEMVGLKMYIVIVGCGKVGEQLADCISEEGHDLVIVDNDPGVTESIVNKYDVMAITGNGASHTVLEEAGAAKADLLIAVTASDELNILSCMVARKMGARHTIARVRDPEYSAQTHRMRRDFGLSMTVNPEADAAHEIVRIIQLPEALKVETFAKGRVDLAELKLSPGNPLCGCRLSELRSRYKVNLLICAVRRGDTVTIPSGDFVLEAEDVIHVTAPHTELVNFVRLGTAIKPIRSVMLIGGGKISYFLARELLGMGIRVKIIEIDEERAHFLAEQLPKATVIHADGTDSDVLLEEGVDTVDATVSLTGVDEENIIISLFSESRKVAKVITKVNRLNMIKMLESIGLECVVSPKSLTADYILRYVRGIGNSSGSGVQTLYTIMDDKAEVLEFAADEGFVSLGVPLKDMKLKKNLLLGCIIRGTKVIYPHGSDTIEAGDSVIVVAESEAMLDSLEDIIE